jgi:hypothetical protein
MSLLILLWLRRGRSKQGEGEEKRRGKKKKKEFSTRERLFVMIKTSISFQTCYNKL